VKSSRYSGDSISDALWMSVSAGVAAVFVVLILSEFIYIFDPAGKQTIENHLFQCLIAAVVVFVGVFGVSLEVSLKDQFWCGKWK
jgi:hypothetical protein